MSPATRVNLTRSRFDPDYASSLASVAHERILWPRPVCHYATQLSDMTTPTESPPTTTPTFRQTLVRVMAVQVVTLYLLWLLQSHYSG
jgi:hypothetical protein